MTLTYHKRDHRLQCHYCGHVETVPVRCPACRAGEVTPAGFGTEKVEEELARLFPVPLHWRKRLRRGYNQAEYLAEGIARALRAEVDRHSVRRIRNNPAQALHRHTERWDNVEGIFAVRRPERLAGHHLLLVDDVLTTGATLLSCAETILRAAPDCRLSVAVLAVPQREFGLDG